MSAQNPRIDPGSLGVRAISSKEQLIKEVVRRSCNIEFAVLDVATHVDASLEVVLAVCNRNQVRITVDILVERLRISSVRSKPHRAVVETDVRNSRLDRCNVAGHIQCVSGT